MVSVTNFPLGSVIPAIRLFGKPSPEDPPILLDQLSNVPIVDLATYVFVFGFDLGRGGYTEVQAKIDTGDNVYPTNWASVTCVRPTATPTEPPLQDPRVTVTFGANCNVQVALTGFRPGTTARIAVTGRIDYPFPFEIPLLITPSATIGSDGSLFLPPFPVNPAALHISEIQARVSIEREQYESGWTPISCSIVAPRSTATPGPTRR